MEKGMGKSWAYALTSAHAGERKRAYGRGAGRLGQKPRRREKYKKFLFHFQTDFTYESNQIGIGFKIHFPVQLKMNNFG